MPRPDPVKFQESKARLQRWLHVLINTHEQIVRDIEWWNANRLDAAPLDHGGDIAVIALAKKVLALIDAEKRVPEELWARIDEQIKANADESEVQS